MRCRCLDDTEVKALFEKYGVLSRARAAKPLGHLPRAVLQDGQRRRHADARDGQDDDLPGGDSLPERAGLDLRQPEGGRLRVRHRHARQDHRAGQGPARQHRARWKRRCTITTPTACWPKPSTSATTCCRPWRRSASTPTSWKAGSPTTSGRCRPTRKCCSSSSSYRVRSIFISPFAPWPTTSGHGVFLLRGLSMRKLLQSQRARPTGKMPRFSQSAD